MTKLNTVLRKTPYRTREVFYNLTVNITVTGSPPPGTSSLYCYFHQFLDAPDHVGRVGVNSLDQQCVLIELFDG